MSSGREVNCCLFFRRYEFALEEVEGFRYRSRDAWRAVTRIAVREARLKEIKQELLNCKKLQVIFSVSFLKLRRAYSLQSQKLNTVLLDKFENLPTQIEYDISNMFFKQYYVMCVYILGVVPSLCYFIL